MLHCMLMAFTRAYVQNPGALAIRSSHKTVAGLTKVEEVRRIEIL